MNLPLITSSPHHGTSFDKFSERVALTPWQISEFSDQYTGDTGFHPDAIGNFKSQVSRGLGSLNQPRDFSLFKLKDFHGNTIWKDGQELTQEEKEYCFTTYYDPYHNEIKRLIKTSKQMGFDKVILWDHHDTGDFDERTGKRDRILPEEPRTMPKFIISNLGQRNTGKIDPVVGYASCSDSFIQQVQTFMSEEFNLKREETEINTIYKGGHIVQQYGNPKNDFGNTVVAIQIEYNRGFIMDQATREPYLDKIKEFNEKFNRVMEKAVSLIIDTK